jgi:hypothetical protein
MSTPNSHPNESEHQFDNYYYKPGKHDLSDANIARMAENSALEGGWMGPMQKEDVAKAYEALGKAGVTVVRVEPWEKQAKTDAETEWNEESKWLEYIDLVCE